MSMRLRCTIVICLITLIIAPATQAQLTWDEDPVTRVVVDPGATIISPITGTATAGGMTVNGDLMLHADADYPRMYVVDVARSFTIDAIPVEVTPFYDWRYKMAVSGGNTEEPYAGLIAAFDIIELVGDSFVTIPSASHGLSDELGGNGWYIGGGTATTGPYVLTPGITYELRVHLQMDLGIQPPDTPTAAGTFELGGVTTFKGFDINLQAQTVPEPTSVMLLALGGLALIRRRRTA